MPGERIKRQIDRLLDKIDDAVARDDWPAVGSLAERVLTLDPGNEDAAAYREAAVRGHDGGLPGAAVSSAEVASSRMRTTEMQEQPPAMSEEQRARRQRVLERRMRERIEGADLDAWYAKLDRRWQSPERLAALLLPTKPVNPPTSDSDPARFIRDLALDPVFQLK